MHKKNYLEYLALSAMFITFFGFFAVKIWDIDFWWHIAAGREILANSTIPSIDPFGVYDAANVWGQTVLKSQWFGQVLLYTVYNWFDIDGVILLRAGVMASCLAIVFLRCRLAGTASLISLSMTALSGMAIMQFTGERPQLFSYFYLSLTFLLLDEFLRSGKRWQLYSIPLVMLVWSNTHAGAMLGLVALGVFCMGYLLEIRWADKSFNTAQSGLLLKVLSLCAVAVACTPNGLATLMRILFVENVFFVESNPLRDRVSEYAYPWTLWPATLYYWIFIAVFLISLPGFFNKRFMKQGIMVAVICIVSLTGYRYIPLFVLLATPYIAASLGRLSNRIKQPPAVAINLFVLVIALVFLGYGFKQGRIFQQGLQEGRFPAGAVAFIKANKLGGKMFNTMNWGGYLIWQLSGTTTAFIDGRMLDPKRLGPYTNILWMTPEGREYFERTNFDMVLVPYGNSFSGERYPLVAYLLNNPRWRAVYQDRLGYLFVKN